MIAMTAQLHPKVFDWAAVNPYASQAIAWMNVMTTRIDTYIANAAASVRSGLKSADATAKTGSSDAPISNVARIDSAKFTPDALQLQKIESSIAKIPVADHQRVAAVRNAIENGSYKVDSQAVASKLARMEWEISLK
ncbi:flagellar biosynthesis anti-sigma factor FlgM [Stenotrophobium rhamnosiphilum]|uniref:Negative regulator of flagellin synthesis n=2 Tax=Stenotrophobium rhamnosiphilum TaxID=2029166 RepID=A0A2T5MDF2_9GAMM|nr:flagellar biosynthesis anti-sigma factor FlgM [Stenotrophobium rhamnosiphilum]